MEPLFMNEEIPVLATIVARYADEKFSGEWMTLESLRILISDKGYPRHLVDSTLRKMYRLDDVHIIPESNQKSLTEAQREASIYFGGQFKHLISINY